MLPGAHRVAGFKSGRWRIYWYAERTRGSAVLWNCSAPTRQAAERIEREEAPAIAERYGAIAHPVTARGFVGRLVDDFKGSEVWKAYAPSTQKLWGDHLDEIRTTFGATSLKGIQRKGVRKLIRIWHEGMKATPRKANTALTVLVRLFEYGLDQEDLERNPAAGLARLEEGESRASIVWTPEEFKTLVEIPIVEKIGRINPRAGEPMLGPARRRALRLAYLTGLRREDLIRLRWSEVDLVGGMIRRTTLKSRKEKRVARITIGPDLRALLLEMKADNDARLASTTVVTTEAGGAYTNPQSFSNALREAFDAADIKAPDGRRKHLHDLRGTRVSLKFAEGCSDAEAEIWFGWAPGQGAKMRGVYGDPETIALAAVERLKVAK